MTAVGWLALAACAASCSPEGPVDVRGVSAVVYLSQAGEWTDPAELTNRDVFVQIDFEANAAPQTGYGYSDGRFLVQDVDAEEFVLHVGAYQVYLERERTQDIRLGYQALGRPDTTWLGDSTAFEFGIAGLTPFEPNDSIAVYVPSIGAGFTIPDTVAGYPSLGDESLDAVVPYSSVPGQVPLLDSAAPDEVFVVQTVARQLGDGLVPRASTVAFRTTASTQAQRTTRIVGEFMEPPAVEVSVTFDPESLRAIEASLPPSSRLVSLTFGVQALPHATAYGWYADALEWWSVSLDGADPVSIRDSFNSPFPADWVVAGWSVAHAVTVMAQGGSEVEVVARTRSSLSSTDMTPLLTVGPVESIRIAGTLADAHVAAAGSSPTIEWSAPASGGASMYSLTVLELVDAKDATPAFAQPVVRLFTLGARARIPAGHLRAQRHYAVLLCALNRSDFSCVVSGTFSA